MSSRVGGAEHRLDSDRVRKAIEDRAVELAPRDLLPDANHRRSISRRLGPTLGQVLAIARRPVPPLLEVEGDVTLHALDVQTTEPCRARWPCPRPALAPVMTQLRSGIHARRSSGPRSGSAEMNRTRAGIDTSSGRFSSARCCSSTVVPSQTFAGQSCPQGASLDTTCGRFVRRSQSRFDVASMSVQRRSRCSSRSRRSSKTSAIEAQNTRAHDGQSH